MLIKLDEYDLKEIKSMEKKIGKCKVLQFGEDSYIEVEEIMGMIEDLNYEYERLEDEKEDLERDLEDNYVPRYKDKYEEYGVSPRDFF